MTNDRNYPFPSETAFAVTPSDSAVYRNIVALYIGTGGDVVVRLRKNGQIITYANVPAGTILRINIDQIRATGTTATDIVALR